MEDDSLEPCSDAHCILASHPRPPGMYTQGGCRHLKERGPQLVALLRNMGQEIVRLREMENEALSIHSCSAWCSRPACVDRREKDNEAEKKVYNTIADLLEDKARTCEGAAVRCTDDGEDPRFYRGMACGLRNFAKNLRKQ